MFDVVFKTRYVQKKFPAPSFLDVDQKNGIVVIVTKEDSRKEFHFDRIDTESDHLHDRYVLQFINNRISKETSMEMIR